VWKYFHAFLPVSCLDYGMAKMDQRPAQHVAERIVVVDEKDPSHGQR
jgi:hypothetical protein